MRRATPAAGTSLAALGVKPTSHGTGVLVVADPPQAAHTVSAKSRARISDGVASDVPAQCFADSAVLIAMFLVNTAAFFGIATVSTPSFSSANT